AMTALSSNEGEFARSTTTWVPASTSASPSPVIVLTPESGDAATTSWPFCRSLFTSFDPVRPVPPMTTIFMTFSPFDVQVWPWGAPGLGESLDCFFGGPKRVCDTTEIDKRGQVAVTLGKPGAGDGIAHDRDFEGLFAEIAKMGLDEEIGEHSGEDDLADTSLAKPEAEIIDLGERAVRLMRRADDRFAIVDVLLQFRHEVAAGTSEVLGGQRNGDGNPRKLRCLEQPREVLDHFALGRACATDGPGRALRAQDIDPRVDHDKRGALEIQLHLGVGRHEAFRYGAWLLHSVSAADACRGHGCGLRCVDHSSTKRTVRNFLSVLMHLRNSLLLRVPQTAA